MDHYENYCLDCEWAASKKNHTRDELASLAIEHAVSMGHDIESRSSPASIDASDD